jgi:hypothetical protein
MKTFKDVKISDAYSADVDVTERKDGSILFVATCGETRREHVMAPQPNHEYSEEQFLKDIDEAKMNVAKEVAGHEHQRLLRSKFFSEGT